MEEKYSKLIEPIDDILTKYNIVKESDKSDIADYYLYSLAKSVENYKNVYGYPQNISDEEVNNFIKIIEEKLYVLTDDQRHAIYDAVEYLNQNKTSSCLIQGDVSSGKTIVAVALMFIVALKKKRSLYLVRRRVLRIQHIKTLKKYNDLFGLDLKIYDASEEFDNREADIVINGYSFSDHKFIYADFSLGIIDEIQLFGVDQRNQIQRMYPNVDMFYTTATPHPRTKLISLIGNMDIIEIRELPPGRRLKNTEAFKKIEEKHVNLINEEAKKGYLTIVVCPLVNKAGSNEYESLNTAYETYSNMFPKLRVEMLRAQYSDSEKEEIIQRAVDGEIDILVATKSIEVGVDIPRASVIIIHYPHSNAIKWGVSQLHQIKGRVGRNNQESFCFIESPSSFSENSPIGLVLKTQDVFELTKGDFNWRGFQSIIGTKQSGRTGTKEEQEQRIKAYAEIAKLTPTTLENMEIEFINILEQTLVKIRVESIN